MLARVRADGKTAMDLERLAAVVALIEAGDMARAAQQCGRSQTQLRADLRAIEDWLGVPVLQVDASGRIEANAEGRRLLPRAQALLADGERLRDLFRAPAAGRELRVICSHYLASYLLIDRLQAFRLRHPDVVLKLSVRTEIQILSALQQDTLCGVGFCAPLESPPGLRYRHWFSMPWSAVLPHGHPLAARHSLSLAELAREPLILFEPGSTGRQHLLQAFHRAGVEPQVALQATTTALIAQMVEAGLGIAVLPLLPSGRVTAGRALAVVPVSDRIEAIDSGIFMRPEWADDPMLNELIDWVTAEAV